MALPESLIVGVASGGDLTSAGRAAIEVAGYGIVKVAGRDQHGPQSVVSALAHLTASAKRWKEFHEIAPEERAA